MARRKYKRRHKKTYHANKARKRQVREGNLIIKDTPNDKAAAHLLGEVFQEKDDVLDATDLNESFKYFNRKRRK